VSELETVPATFLAALDVDLRGNHGHARVPPSWAQGRATFGGMLVAMALQAARQRVDPPRPVRGLVAVFPAPISPGEVEVRVREFRHGRAVSYVEGIVAQGGEPGCVLQASFGNPRESQLEVEPSPAPAAPPPDQCDAMMGTSAGAPEFTRHLEYRLAFGERPYSGADSRELGGWCRFRNEPGPLREEHVVALLDAWPTPAVSRMTAPAPAATVTWAMELLEIEPDIPSDAWWLYRAELEASAGGYAHSSARLWSPAGKLAALGRQVVAVFG